MGAERLRDRLRRAARAGRPDRRPRRPPATPSRGGIALFTLASALCGLLPSVPALVAARVVQAVGAAFLLPTSLALLLPAFPPRGGRCRSACGRRSGGVAAAARPAASAGCMTEVVAARFPRQRAGRDSRRRSLPAASWPRRATPLPRRLPTSPAVALLVAAIALLSLGLVQAPEWGCRATRAPSRRCWPARSA